MGGDASGDSVALRWPRRATWRDGSFLGTPVENPHRRGDDGRFKATQGDTVEIDDPEIVEHYLSRGWVEVGSDDDPEAERDPPELPDDWDPDALDRAIDALKDELPRGSANLALEQIALQRAHGHLLEMGSATSSELSLLLSAEDLPRYYASGGEFWRAIRPYLSLLPGVIPPDAGGKWKFDPDGQIRPERPDAPTSPDDEALGRALGSIDWPGAEGDPIRNSHRLGVRRMYETLQEQGEALTSELKEHAVTGNYGGHTGHFGDAGSWFREVGRPALNRLPGVDPPRVAGDPWRSVGIDHDPVDDVAQAEH